ncbi:toll/interleukin-1 receptor domain-containing protein [Klenkia sp. PcliD-1-E]|uniref:toll/interleukin-1 receptor domain-containing protein n=1 Tax=Klenkia sp. PcliD-1-E TaxID=2954492 RepID=UPI0020968908|nr:toll/interleukin-1 receptor domain-containing protein [Klenkia sp. PcliD-1-E]MCO7219367.1 toll/interleukin-1 receptor domain-containing protein [Klenkia sp. PcliD-1-E]
MPEQPGPASGSRFDAFISYQSRSSQQVASYLQRELEQVARRSVDEAPVRIFRDATDLTFGGLAETLQDRLRNSRRLVVVLHRETRASPWVNQEIEYWLAHGGTPDRLILVLADPALDLSWDDTTGQFRHEEALPPALHGRFPSEPLWLNLSARRLGRPWADEGEVARLCATLMERDPADLLQREVRIQRARRRRLRALLAGAVALSLVAVAAGVVAVLSSREADRQRLQAEAQARAAEALLVADQRPDLALKLLSQASADSADSSVRAAMLSVLDQNRRLERVVDMSGVLGGAAPDDIGLSDDGRRVTGWRATPEGWVIGVWDVDSGQVLVNAVLPEGTSEVSNLALVGDDLVAYCTTTGPRLVRLTAGGASAVDGVEAGGLCLAGAYQGGFFLLGREGAVATVLLADAATGKVARYEGVRFGGTNPLADVAVVERSDGVLVQVGAGLTETELNLPADVLAGQVQEVDGWGRLTVRATDGRLWRTTGSGSEGDYAPVPADALAAAPLDGAFPGWVWVTPDGRLAWSLDGQTVDVSAARAPVENRPADDEVSLTVVSTSYDATAVAVFGSVAGNSAGFAEAAVVDLSPSPGYRAMTARDTLTSLSGDAVAGAEQVFLPSGFGNGGELVNSSISEQITGAVFTDAADRLLLEVDDSSLILRQPGAGAEVISDGPDVRAFAFAADGTTLAVARGAGSVGVYSTYRADDLPEIASTDSGPASAVTAFGSVSYLPVEGGVLREADGGARVVVSADQETSVTIRTASPDGERVVVASTANGQVDPDEDDAAPPVSVVDRSGRAEQLEVNCGFEAQDVGFLPGPHFTTDVGDAEAQQLAVRWFGDGSGSSNGGTDCVDGEDVELPGVAVLDYEMDADRGRIVSDDGERVRVTTWQRGEQDTLRTLDLPGVVPGSTVQLDDAGRTAVAFVPGDTAVTVLDLADDETGWTQTHSVATSLTEVVGASSTPSGLLAVAGTDGQLHLYDLESGRLVLRTRVADGVDGPFRDMSVTEEDGILTVRVAFVVEEELSNGGGVVRVPISVDRLRTLVCAKIPSSAGC